MDRKTQMCRPFGGCLIDSIEKVFGCIGKSDSRISEQQKSKYANGCKINGTDFVCKIVESPAYTDAGLLCSIELLLAGG